MSCQISLAATSDARAIAALRTTVAQDMTRRFGAGDWSVVTRKATVLRQLRASHVLVARQDERIVGTVRLVTALPSLFDSRSFTVVPTAVYVLGLCVAPDYRGQGIGAALMDAAKRAAVSWPAQALWLDAYDHAAGAGEFYRRCGFRQVGVGRKKELSLLFFEWLDEKPLRAG